MSPERLTYTADEVAAVLGLDPSYFRLKRPSLEAAGFPKRLPTLVGRWSRPAVDAWIASSGELAPPLGGPSAEIIRIDEARHALELRYGGAA